MTRLHTQKLKKIDYMPFKDGWSDAATNEDSYKQDTERKASFASSTPSKCSEIFSSEIVLP